MAFTPITVTGTYMLPGGAPASGSVSYASGSVSFTPTAEMRDPATSMIVSTQETTVMLDEFGSFSISLFATNDIGVVPNGVTYEVNERLNETSWNKYFISIDKESPDGIFDLASVIPNEQPVTTYNYATKEYVDYLSANLPFIPTSEISATTVQTAIEQVRELSRYVHNQPTASTNWVITHNLKMYPSVTIVDSGGTHVMGEVTYNTLNTALVEFTSPFSGKAYLS